VTCSAWATEGMDGMLSVRLQPFSWRLAATSRSCAAARVTV